MHFIGFPDLFNTKTMYTRLFLLFCSVVMASAGNGGSGWQISGNRRFQCFESAVNYTDAATLCSREGGRLASEVLRDPTAASYIAENCVGAPWGAKRPWVGYDELANQGQWIWSDGGATNPSTTEWKAGEPNNLQDESCGQIWDRSVFDGMLFLNDNRCDKLFHYICEI